MQRSGASITIKNCAKAQSHAQAPQRWPSTLPGPDVHVPTVLYLRILPNFCAVHTQESAGNHFTYFHFSPN